jgi:hypothetical protein
VKDHEEFKAYSQNMMHESMEITDRLYGRLNNHDVKRIIQNDIERDGELASLIQEFMEWKSKR